MEFRTLRADEIECRAKQVTEKGMFLLLYKDARADQILLDETVGPMNWQRHHSRENANCTVAIWDQQKGQWIEKEDTGTESNTEAEKGLASDSFKRACVNWGIGRELYTAPKIWIKAEDINWEDKKDKNGKPYTYDKFEVSRISYDEFRNISGLQIRNAKTKKVVFNFGSVSESAQEKAEPKAEPKHAPEPKPEPKPETMTEQQAAATAVEIGQQKIDAIKIAALTTAAADQGVTIDKILKLYKRKSLAEINEKQFSHINANWEKIKAL